MKNPCPCESRRSRTALNLFQILTDLKCTCIGCKATGLQHTSTGSRISGCHPSASGTPSSSARCPDSPVPVASEQTFRWECDLRSVPRGLRQEAPANPLVGRLLHLSNKILLALLGNSCNRSLGAPFAHIEGSTYLSTFLPGDPELPEHDPDLNPKSNVGVIGSPRRA